MSAAENPTSEFASTYILSSHQEVLDRLSLVAAKHARVVVSFVDGGAELSAKLAGINLHFDEIILADEFTPTSAVGTLPQLAPDLVTILSDRNKLQFHIDHIERTVFDGKPALRVRIPKMVYCSERRESARISPPLDQSLRCLIPDSDSKQTAEVELPVIDISAGGLALMAHPLKLEVHVGKELRGCRLALPDIGDTSFSLVIRSITEASQAVEGRRCGCQFSDIGKEMLALVERYVTLHRDSG
jgi:c-di-GMP-binding flagellar brake protein YcgR